jgi:lysozyme
MNKTLSSKGAEFLQHQEGFSAKAYPDAGRFSIGFGYLLESPEDKAKYMHATLTRDEAWALSHKKLDGFEAVINSAVKVDLKQHQFDALVSLTYNIGSSGFLISTCLKLVNQGHFFEAAKWFAPWCKSEGKVNRNLKVRRGLEAYMFHKGEYVIEVKEEDKEKWANWSPA